MLVGGDTEVGALPDVSGEDRLIAGLRNSETARRFGLEGLVEASSIL